MDFKKELKRLVEIVKSYSREQGRKVTNEELATRLGYTRSYFSTLLGESGKVYKEHVDNFTAHFQKELSGAAGITAGDPMNPEKALFFAFLLDYAEWKAEKTGRSLIEVKREITKRGHQILHGFDSWLPE